MPFCASCGKETDVADAYCAACGSAQKAAPEKKARSNPRRIGCFLVGQFVALAVLMVFLVGGKGCAEVKGELTATGLAGGDARFVPEVCQSGQHQSFFGVSLVRKVGGGAIVAIEDAVQGKVVKVNLPGPCGNAPCPPLELRPDGCTTLDLVLERTNTEVNDIRLLDGHLKLDCTVGTVHVQGAFEFSNCN